MRRVIRLVVHPLWRGVAEKHVRRGQPAGELRRLLLRVLVRAFPVADGALEPRKAPVADALEREMNVADAERRQLVVAVVIAVNAEARQIQGFEGGDPRGVQVAERDDGVGVVGGDELRGVHGRRFVGEGEEAHP